MGIQHRLVGTAVANRYQASKTKPQLICQRGFGRQIRAHHVGAQEPKHTRFGGRLAPGPINPQIDHLGNEGQDLAQRGIDLGAEWGAWQFAFCIGMADHMHMFVGRKSRRLVACPVDIVGDNRGLTAAQRCIHRHAFIPNQHALQPQQAGGDQRGTRVGACGQARIRTDPNCRLAGRHAQGQWPKIPIRSLERSFIDNFAQDVERLGR